MAYVSQELKAKLTPQIKAVCKKYGIKATVAVRRHSTLVVNISQGRIDFIKNFNKVNARKPGFVSAKDYIDVNIYWYREHFDGEALQFLQELIPAMNVGNHDRSDIQTDYHDVGWYVDVNIGRWNKPYALAE